jgi:hypothetical protein
MTPHARLSPARRISPCPGCGTCARSRWRDWLAWLFVAVFVAYFVVRMVWP